MTGLRKKGQIRSLTNLNKRLNLGYSEKEIQEMTVGQLRRKIIEAKLDHGIKIPNHSRIDSIIKTRFEESREKPAQKPRVYGKTARQKPAIYRSNYTS